MPLAEQIMTNPHADRVKKLADQRTKRGQGRSGRFLIEGPQAVREAVAMEPQKVTDIYYVADQCHDHTIIDMALQKGMYVHETSAAVMEQISPDAQGIITSAAITSIEHHYDQLTDLNDLLHNPQSIGLLAACWQARDPGNEGTIIRTADAAGCEAVILIGDCVSPFNSKVVRSTAGSLFHIPVYQVSEEEFFTWIITYHLTLCAADIHGTPENPPRTLTDLLFSDEQTLLTKTENPLIILFGNEARGLPQDLVRRTQQSIIIPLYGQAESLNLASSVAILLYSISMARHQRHL